MKDCNRKGILESSEGAKEGVQTFQLNRRFDIIMAKSNFRFWIYNCHETFTNENPMRTSRI